VAVPRPADALSDKELVLRILEGHQEDFRVLLGCYRNLVYGQAIRWLGDADEAENQTQEVFLSAYQNLDRLRDPEAFGAWLSTITRNKCMNLIRTIKIKQVSLEALAEMGIQPPAPEPVEDPTEDQLRLMHRCIARLPREHREIIELHYTREISYDAMASYLGISMSAVKLRLYHARQKMIKLLKREGVL